VSSNINLLDTPEELGPLGLGSPETGDTSDAANLSKAREKKGRRWLIWSFIFCPCHLPLTMGLLALVFGGTAFGALLSRNTLGVGLAVGTIYAIGVGIGLRHIRAETKDIDCSGDTCEVKTD
jgi:mercuric ion transport protein